VGRGSRQGGGCGGCIGGLRERLEGDGFWPADNWTSGRLCP
jgi:hypothetical protein